MDHALRKDFSSRSDLQAYLREQFPCAGGDLSPIRGGKLAALTALGRFDASPYQRTRNFLSGAVSRLSPYLRHGVLTLPFVRRAAKSSRKFVQELAWRDYWQRIYAELGDGVWIDREEYKTGHPPTCYVDELPADISEARTGLVCIDTFSRELADTGYLHNHARMWMAAYVVHWRRIRWQAGAGWFLRHLLDGDPASNNLSWQWIASTFSQKPYFFNRENLEKYTEGCYCHRCPRYGACEFEGSYEELAARLFR